MKNLNIIKWIVSLDAGKQVLAILLVIISILYIDLKTSRSEKDIGKDELRIQADKAYTIQLRQQEMCDSAITAIRMEYNKKYEEFLKEQIQKLETSKKENESVISKNRVLLKKNGIK